MAASPAFPLLVQNYSTVTLGILPLQANVSDGPPGPWLPDSTERWEALSSTVHAASPELYVWCETAWPGARTQTFHATPPLSFIRAGQVWMVLCLQLLKSEYSDSFTCFLLRPCQRNEDFSYCTLLRETSLSKSEHFWSWVVWISKTLSLIHSPF